MMLQHNLTDREQEIGICLINGMSMQQIATKLGVSVHTVDFHKRNIKNRLNSNNSYQLGFLLANLLSKQ